jgi:hypothetical protein
MPKQLFTSKTLIILSLVLNFYVVSYASAITRAPGSGSATSSPVQPIPEGVNPNVNGSVEYSHPVRPGDGDNTATNTNSNLQNGSADNTNTYKLGFASNGFNWLWLIGIIIVGIIIFGIYRMFKKQDEN